LNISRSTYLDDLHRAVIFAITQLSCLRDSVVIALHDFVSFAFPAQRLLTALYYEVVVS